MHKDLLGTFISNPNWQVPYDTFNGENMNRVDEDGSSPKKTILIGYISKGDILELIKLQILTGVILEQN